MRALKVQPLLAIIFVLALQLVAGVRSEMSITSFRPDNGATDVCIDTPLYITFDQKPEVGKTGRLRVYRADGTLVDSIDVADPDSYKRPIGGAQSMPGQLYLFNYDPILVTGNTAAIYLHRSLDYGQTYYVTIDPGVFTDAEGHAFPGIRNPDGWRFTTKAAGPPVGATSLTVAASGRGDFCTVQGAIDFVPQNNTRPVVITVRRGTYNEINYVRSNKPFITIRGEDRERCVIQYVNNNNRNTGNFRVMFGVDATDFTLENITLHNLTPYLGSQAEAFRSGNLRVLLNRVNLKSFQDTLLMQVQGFVTNSYIEGDVDFMWGGGEVFFQNCELKALHAGYYVQARNPIGFLGVENGYVYVNCRLTRAPDLADATAYLARIDPNVFPKSQVVFIDCAMDAHIKPEGWLLNNATAAPEVQFWEYNSTDLDEKPLDVSQRARFSRQLTDKEATYWSDPANVLRRVPEPRGWVPYTVNASPDSVAAGATITVDWSGADNHSPTDWVGLYRVGAPDTDVLSWQYTDSATTGHMTFTAPRRPGRYEFRYFLNDGFTRAATSNRMLVTRHTPDDSGPSG